ncbi:MAG: tripartite tricarboxylate transporter substrate binding protein [Betaproteobacteria bacterium]|nr:tripartite tricarboxylate transporter substrate binding protein [Betaproteobacteria bacterium]MBI3935751.1 tripartite tricarboxylate transporter substrate binding protein [Betaproteobacteria bacterium]
MGRRRFEMFQAGFLRFMSSAALPVATCASAMFLGVVPSMAQQSAALAAYPVKSIRIIVASSPGTADDFFARSLGEELGAFYRQRVVIENRSGAGGLIGNILVSRANADGYTLGMVSVTRIITELVREQPPYRALADIVGVAHVASITNVLAVTPSIPARTAPEFVRHARARVGEYNYASLGIGSASHLAGEVFTRAVGVDAMHVPFRNLSDSFVEMVLGRVHYAVLTLPAVLGPLREGRMRALAVMTRQRSPTLPAVPAIAEVGLPEAQFDSWSGIVAPKGTPRRIVEQLHGDIVRGLRKAALRDLFVRHGAESTPESTPDGFMRLMQSEYLRYQALIRERGIKPE